MTSLIHLDLSEIVSNPLRSGIQRVVREAIRHWPGPAQLQPCCVDPVGQFLSLPAATLYTLCDTSDTGTADAREVERQTLKTLIAAGKPVRYSDMKQLLNLELFYNAARADTYLQLAASGIRVSWYLYDFLPFLRPDLFPSGTTRHCMHFLRALRGASHLAFLSEQTRNDYAVRVARTKSAMSLGPVISPGADGLGLERQRFSSSRRDFVSLGTLEQRKNTIALLEAFELLWQKGHDVRLVVAGRLSSDAASVVAFFRKYANDPHLVVLEEPADEDVREVLRGARALVMPSEAEGFGLPPYEAVHVGIPAIASESLPSTAEISEGVLLLSRMDSVSIAEAVESLCDDSVAEQLWAEAARVQLPNWVEFGRNLGAWAQMP